MPYLLLLFIPAITMSTWADERRQGTDELLLTLPAHDLDVVLGKYLAALGIYTVALAFSLPQVFVLLWLGAPDLGVLFATYFGYWLMGVLLIALGMVASLLSSNVTVAFILGALFCAVPIFLGHRLDSRVTGLGVCSSDGRSPSQFQDFGTGVIPLVGLFYFVGLAAAMLYLNMVLLGRRHWAGGEASRDHWLHSPVRFVAVVIGPRQPDRDGQPLRRPPRRQLRSSCTRSRPSRSSWSKKIPADRPVSSRPITAPRSRASSSRPRPTCSACSRNTRPGAAARSG